MGDITTLDRKISAVCPIHGVSIGDATDKETWRIDYKSEATEEQRAAASAVLATFSFDDLVIPESVTPLQARRALRAAGVLDAVLAAVAVADDDTKDAWEYTTVMHRDNPVLLSVAAQLNLTSEQIDALFIAAAQL